MTRSLKASNPFYAYVNLQIGKYKITQLPPKHIQQFSYERVTLDAANKIIISAIDETALILEQQLISSMESGKGIPCKFNYGYSGGAQSPTYAGLITEYDVDFQSSHAVLNIEGVSKGLSKFGVPRIKAYKNMYIHEIVAQIASEEGWDIGHIEQCEPVYDGDDKQVMKTFIRNNLPAVKFITQELSPYARKAGSKEGGFRLNFKDSSPQSAVNYAPPSYKSQKDMKFYEFQWGTSADSPVISFNPNYSGIVTAMKGGGTIEASTVHKLRNEMFKVTHSGKTDKKRYSLGNRGVGYESKQIVSNSSYSENEMQNIAATMWYQNASQSYPAEMELVGDPNIEPQSMISIMMLNKDGLPHHSSGVYLVTQVVDSISDGSFTTKLDLVRNALNVGVSSSGGINVTLNTNYAPAGKAVGAGGASSTPVAGTASEQAVVKYCASFKGVPYVYGSQNPPKSFDCSSLVQYVYKHFGINIPRVAQDQSRSGKAVSTTDVSAWRPGDLIFYNWDGGEIDHVAMYIGNGKRIHAPHKNDVVKEADAHTSSQVVAVRRLL